MRHFGDESRNDNFGRRQELARLRQIGAAAARVLETVLWPATSSLIGIDGELHQRLGEHVPHLAQERIARGQATGSPMMLRLATRSATRRGGVWHTINEAFFGLEFLHRAAGLAIGDRAAPLSGAPRADWPDSQLLTFSAQDAELLRNHVGLAFDDLKSDSEHFSLLVYEIGLAFEWYERADTRVGHGKSRGMMSLRHRSDLAAMLVSLAQRQAKLCNLIGWRPDGGRWLKIDGTWADKLLLAAQSVPTSLVFCPTLDQGAPIVSRLARGPEVSRPALCELLDALGVVGASALAEAERCRLGRGAPSDGAGNELLLELSRIFFCRFGRTATVSNDTFDDNKEKILTPFEQFVYFLNGLIAEQRGAPAFRVRGGPGRGQAASIRARWHKGGVGEKHREYVAGRAESRNDSL